MTAAVPLGVDPGPAPTTSAAGVVRWVHDPEDDQACLHHLAALHAPGAGRVVCHPTPGATSPILARDLLEALGKRRDALTRARRALDGVGLVRVWMRAERVEHLVVLRAHRLRPPLLEAFAELAAATGATVWLVWHHTDPPASGWPGEVWSWPRAVDAIRGHARPDPSARLRPVETIYWEAVAEARREARLWRVAPPRQRRYTQPGCGLSALLQRLTIDATTEAELHLHLHAARTGFAAEGLTLVLPPEPAALAALGPRITPHVVARLRRIACPSSAAALLLALATDARAGRVAGCKSPQHQPGPRAGPAAVRHPPHPRARAAAAARGTARPPGPRAARARPVRRGAWWWAAAPPGHGQPHRPRRRARRPPDPTCGHLSRAWRLRPGGTVRHRPRQQRRCPDRRRRASPTTTTSPATSSAVKARSPGCALH